MGKLKIWAAEEDEVLARVSSTVKSKRWKKASEELRRQGYERSDVECRQRYINHLDPSVNKQLWSDDELQVLYSKYGQYGNKWFLLQKHLPGRTQTKIKNYFYGNIRYFLKIIIKFFNKKSTGFVNDIKTETLLDMYEAKNSFNGYAIIPRTIKKLRYRVEKHACERMIRENQEAFCQFVQQFMGSYVDKGVTKGQQEREDREEREGEEEEERESDSVGVVRVECATSCTRVSVVSSIGGEVGSIAEELQHLRRMSMSHFGWYEHYQKAYQALQAKVEQTL